MFAQIGGAGNKSEVGIVLENMLNELHIQNESIQA